MILGTMGRPRSLIERVRFALQAPGVRLSKIYTVAGRISYSSIMAQENFDRSRAAAFARQVGTDFGAALTVAMAFIGDRLGLFRLLASGEPMRPRRRLPNATN